MDRLSVGLAVSRGRRIFHGQPFVVFTLDLRDPLGSCLTRLLHSLGDSRSPEEVRKRAERLDRAPIVTVPSSMEHARMLLPLLTWTPEMEARDGCTFGDLNAVRDFILSHRSSGGEVSVFLAADEERSVFHVAYPSKGRPLSVAFAGAPQAHEAEPADG
jgi:hypothetical protein